MAKQTSSGSGRSKLVTSTTYSHISLALKPSAMGSDMVELGVLLFKAPITIEHVFEGQSGEGSIIFGTVLDNNLKPCYAVLNRGGPLHCVIGPNRIHFDASGGEDYRIHLPAEYARLPADPLRSCS